MSKLHFGPFIGAFVYYICMFKEWNYLQPRFLSNIIEGRFCFPPDNE